MDTLRRDAERLIRDRALSRAELTARLEAKGHVRDAIESLLNEYERLGAIDDRVLAREIADAELSKRPCSAAFLEHRLTRRGIDPALSGEIARERTSCRDPFEDALVVARSALLTMRRKSPDADRRRLIAALARRGYDEDLCLAVADRLLPSPSEP